MPTNVDPQAINMHGSYAPPTSAVGQGGALQSADQQDMAFTTDAPLTSAAEFNAAHGPTQSGQRGGLD